MRVITKGIRKALFGISLNEATFKKRGFIEVDINMRIHLETAGKKFVAGYNTSLDETDPAKLVPTLNEHEIEYQGFVFEGAAMGLALLDLITPWNRGRLKDFLKIAGNKHIYMIHVGAGWALARLKKRIPALEKSLNPVFKWLAIDGYGFHQGYFNSIKFINNHEIQSGFCGYSLKAFDQGLGRSIWFVNGAEIDRVIKTVNSFEKSRQSDLWSGIGLACTYAGKIEEDELLKLKQSAGPFAPDLAQGSSFAVKARIAADSKSQYTENACRILCGLSALEASEYTDKTFENLPDNNEIPSYEIWRSRLRDIFSVKSGIPGN